MTVGREVAAAAALLTRLPITAPADRPGAAAFGLVGALLGLATAAPVLLIGPSAPLAGGVLAVGVLALASGALHLDGLADTADALAAPTADAAERARRDPRSGPAGVAAIVIAVVLDAALLAALGESRAPLAAALAVVAAVSTSRAAAALAGGFDRRSRAGFGGWFAAHSRPGGTAVAVATPLVIGVLAIPASGGPAPLAAVVIGLAAGSAAAMLLNRVRGSLDGDAFGAVVEITLAAALSAAVVAG
jgi:adenosylcobinamide-GDP ribazoletransferase